MLSRVESVEDDVGEHIRGDPGLSRPEDAYFAFPLRKEREGFSAVSTTEGVLTGIVASHIFPMVLFDQECELDFRLRGTRLIAGAEYEVVRLDQSERFQVLFLIGGGC